MAFFFLIYKTEQLSGFVNVSSFFVKTSIVHTWTQIFIKLIYFVLRKFVRDLRQVTHRDSNRYSKKSNNFNENPGGCASVELCEVDAKRN